VDERDCNGQAVMLLKKGSILPMHPFLTITMRDKEAFYPLSTRLKGRRQGDGE